MNHLILQKHNYWSKMVFFKRLNKEFVIAGIDILFYHSGYKYVLKYDYYLKFLKI